LYVSDLNGLHDLQAAQVQPQCSDCGVEVIDDVKGLDVNGFLKLSKELFDTRESRAGNKRAEDEVLFLAFDPYLANLPLPGIHQINDLCGTYLHV
jgi:hypothetical protein